MSVRAFLAGALFALAATAAQAEGPPGATTCAGCHGLPGSSSGGSGPVPPLVGRPAAEIVAEMQAFRTGTRDATIMDRIAKGFSDAETRAIADWLAAGGGGANKP